MVKKRLIVIAIGLILVSVVATVLLSRRQPSAAPKSSSSPAQTSSQASNTPPTTAQLVDVIGGDDYTDVHYTINSTQEPTPGWFVVRVTATNSYGNFDQLAVVQRLSNGQLTVVAGPDTSFNLNAVHQSGIPQAVIDTIPTYTP